MAILSQRALAGLKAYKYKPGGYTLLDHIHTPFWNWLTERLPMWLAPNLITLSGLALMFAAYLINWVYLPEYTGEAPSWVYILSGISVIVYTNLDCIDGKQARRTKTSSPLGQLFDHGCDAISLHIMLSLAQCAFARQSDYMSAIILQAVKLPWLVSHYEEYHTGILMYGDGNFGILEANYTLAGIMLATGIYGPKLWKQPLLSLLPVDKLPADLVRRIGPNAELEHVFLVITFLGGLMQLLGQLSRVFCSPVSKLAQDERGNKELGLGPRVKHLLYCFGVVGAGCVYIGHKDLRPAQSRLEALIEGVIYAYVATQLIMDHMCKEPFRPPLLVFGSLLAVAANCVFTVIPTHLIAYVFAPIITIAYLRYVVGIVNEVCAYLNIKCLTIKPRKD